MTSSPGSWTRTNKPEKQALASWNCPRFLPVEPGDCGNGLSLRFFQDLLLSPVFAVCPSFRHEGLAP
jgi:hypothetical protein